MAAMAANWRPTWTPSPLMAPLANVTPSRAETGSIC